jgi:hypothetical protein
MAVKKTTKKAAPKVGKGDALKCGICGYRVIVDEACGCVEEHFLICCEERMKKAPAKKAAKKKTAAKKKAAVKKPAAKKTAAKKPTAKKKAKKK